MGENIVVLKIENKVCVYTKLTEISRMKFIPKGSLLEGAVMLKA